jgi:hypothetical protein
VDLKRNDWRTVQLAFLGEKVNVSIDGKLRSKELVRTNFNDNKRNLLWMQNGGEEGLELDDVHIEATAVKP